jgi:hypothetical protein
MSFIVIIIIYFTIFFPFLFFFGFFKTYILFSHFFPFSVFCIIFVFVFFPYLCPFFAKFKYMSLFKFFSFQFMVFFPKNQLICSFYFVFIFIFACACACVCVFLKIKTYKLLFTNACLYLWIKLCGTTKDEFVINKTHLHMWHQQLDMYHHVTMVIEAVATYCQVHDIINEHVSEKKVFLWRRSNMSSLLFSY